MKELIDRNIEYLTKLTKQEADFVAHILDWDDEQKIAFKIAKGIFDEELNADEP